MASAGTGGGGVTVSYNSQPVAEVRTVGSTSPEAPKIDLSSHDTVQFRDFVYGLADRGDIRLDGIFIPGDAGQDALQDAEGDGDSHAFLITFPNGTTIAGNAGVTSWGFSAPYTDAHTFTATLGITGDITITPAS